MPGGLKVRGTKVEGVQRILALLYADDLVLICKSNQDLRKCLENLERATTRWGLTINVSKTKAMATNADSGSGTVLTINGGLQVP